MCLERTRMLVRAIRQNNLPPSQSERGFRDL